MIAPGDDGCKRLLANGKLDAGAELNGGGLFDMQYSTWLDDPDLR
jgi:hypothetical protein